MSIDIALFVYQGTHNQVTTYINVGAIIIVFIQNYNEEVIMCIYGIKLRRKKYR